MYDSTYHEKGGSSRMSQGALKAISTRCVKCNKRPSEVGKPRCGKCMADNRRYNDTAWERRLAAGLCTACGKRPSEKPLKRCRPCADKRNKQTLERFMKRKYGIGSEGKRDLHRKQGGFCAFCGLPLLLDKDCHIDHDHITRAVRGLVHRECNLLLGMYEKFGPRFFDCVKVYLGECF